MIFFVSFRLFDLYACKGTIIFWFAQMFGCKSVEYKA